MSCAEDVSKTQAIRIADVVLIGPLMIAAGLRRPLNAPWSTILVLSGIGTIIYNGMNWKAQRELDT